MELYNGTKDLLEHLDTFKAHVTLQGFPKEIACLVAFPLTLMRAARTWFGSLLPWTVGSFEELTLLFMTQFVASWKRRLPAAYLLTVKQ